MRNWDSEGEMPRQGCSTKVPWRVKFDLISQGALETVKVPMQHYPLQGQTCWHVQTSPVNRWLRAAPGTDKFSITSGSLGGCEEEVRGG